MAPVSLRRVAKNGKGRSRGDVSVASGVTDVSLSLDDDDVDDDDYDDRRGPRSRRVGDHREDGGSGDVLLARRTESLDAPHVMALAAAASDYAMAQFGRVDVARVWEKSALSITLTTGSEVVVAQAAFADFPNVDGVDQVGPWPAWVYCSKNSRDIRATF